MPAPYMYDASGKTSEDVQYKVEQIDEGEYVLYVAPDAEWINSEDRIFPVTVDPTVIVGNPTESDRLGTGDILYKIVANREEYDKHPFFDVPLRYANLGFRKDIPAIGIGDRESYLYFGFVDIDQLAGENVKSAKLLISVKEYDARKAKYFTVHGITGSRDWLNTNLDWQNKPAFNAEIISIAKPVVDDYGNGYLEFDITQAMYNHYTGIVIKAAEFGAQADNYVRVYDGWYDDRVFLLSITYSNINQVK